MTEANKIPVEVAYALPDKQEIVMLEVEPGTTAQAAVELSNITRQFPGLVTEGAKLGIFGKAVKFDHVLHAGDRVEIYRPLQADPKEIRKQRAAEAKQRRAEQKGN
jgi:putative ubiquitin-RnfH superfamily antitoxin RatB of RatAB toxin-antitoxin module